MHFKHDWPGVCKELRFVPFRAIKNSSSLLLSKHFRAFFLVKRLLPDSTRTDHVLKTPIIFNMNSWWSWFSPALMLTWFYSAQCHEHRVLSHCPFALTHLTWLFLPWFRQVRYACVGTHQHVTRMQRSFQEKLFGFWQVYSSQWCLGKRVCWYQC